jgi:hypothetical protein
MALKFEVLYDGHRNALCELVAAGFTQQNYDPTLTYVNDTLDAETPIGVLAGSVAGIHGALLNGPGNATNEPYGFFMNNAVGNPFENSPGVASNKVTVINVPGCVLKLPYYETHTVAGAPQTYAAGDDLYASPTGFVTKDSAGVGVDSKILGYVLDVPTTDDPRLTIITAI